jgi:hypothetical protein
MKKDVAWVPSIFTVLFELTLKLFEQDTIKKGCHLGAILFYRHCESG